MNCPRSPLCCDDQHDYHYDCSDDDNHDYDDDDNDDDSVDNDYDDYADDYDVSSVIE